MPTVPPIALPPEPPPAPPFTIPAEPPLLATFAPPEPPFRGVVVFVELQAAIRAASPMLVIDFPVLFIGLTSV
jgi:hypothetical protein